MVCGNVSISFRSSFSSGPLPSQKSFFYLGLLGLFGMVTGSAELCAYQWVQR
jgi:hypothetical protein